MSDAESRYGMTLDQRLVRIEKCIIELARTVQILDWYKASRGGPIHPPEKPDMSAVESLCVDAIADARECQFEAGENV